MPATIHLAHHPVAPTMLGSLLANISACGILLFAATLATAIFCVALFGLLLVPAPLVAIFAVRQTRHTQ